MSCYSFWRFPPSTPILSLWSRVIVEMPFRCVLLQAGRMWIVFTERNALVDEYLIFFLCQINRFCNIYNAMPFALKTMSLYLFIAHRMRVHIVVIALGLQKFASKVKVVTKEGRKD